MGCGNSSSAATNAKTNNNISSNEGQADPSSRVSNESPEDDRHRNYGGVYVGLPTDLDDVPKVKIGSLRETDRDTSSLMKPLWGDGAKF